jgi:asparagine synthase (glutamine-hydrolysing)
MCGIGGIYNLDGRAIDTGALDRMTKLIKHRGPDDEGFLVADTANGRVMHCYGEDTIAPVKEISAPLHGDFKADLGFGFRRLAILDPSERGHQPMSNEDGTLWIVFNGEVYNYIELREELRDLGYKFNSGTDTEVIIKAYEHWGEECLNRFNGMWSFAIWDTKTGKLFCARDRFGIKPFYYFFDGNRFIFGSEIKQVILNDVGTDLDPDMIYKSFAITGYLVTSEHTFFKNVRILPHSHFLTIWQGKLKIERYYDLPVGNFEKSRMTFEDACERYRELFMDSVRLRMRSDVEVGSALSGGLDSSAIVMLAAGFTGNRFKTFSSYYPIAPRFDERKWMQLVIDRVKADGHFISAPVSTILNDLEKITWHHDYPVPGSSPLAQYYVMQCAREKGAIVMLDGQGSDEITGGYNHTFYRYYADMIRKARLLQFTREYYDYLRFNDKGGPAGRIIKTLLAAAFSESTLYYYEARSKPRLLTISPLPKKAFIEIRDLNVSKLSNFLYNLMMSTSIQSLLHYEDRNSMAHSVESRVPFLDYRLVEFAFSLPGHFKIHKNYGKYIHREALRNIVPPEIMQRKDKIGFATPGEAYWMRGEMKEYIMDMLNSARFRNREIYNHKLIDREFRKYFNGSNKNADMLWKVIALENWFRAFKIN